MARRAYARRYAQAVFEIALGKDELDLWQADLAKVASLAGDAALIGLLQNPKVPFETKAKLISGALGEVHPLVLNLVYLLLLKGRLGMLGDIADEYRRLLDGHRGIERAEVMTAVPLDDADRQVLAERLGAITGKKITVEAKGEILALKDTINVMVDQLASFSDEVTRVAREVGTDGKLGGQAKVEGLGKLIAAHVIARPGDAVLGLLPTLPK